MTDISRPRSAQAKHAERVFMVVSSSDQQRQSLKEMIEFLDVLPVRVSEPKDWLNSLGNCRLVAIFLGAGLEESDMSLIVSRICQIEADTPVVVLSEDSDSKQSIIRSKLASANVYSLRLPPRLDELAHVLNQAWSLRRRNRPSIRKSGSTSDLIGDSKELSEIRDLIARVAPTESTVLLSGESGTGKEVIARRIHALSGREGKFVAINCGAIPDHLLETELFGHERGAFTGADSARTGRFEWANGGTLFLDEIGDMPPALQVKLLRVLQERVIERIGGAEEIPVNIRLVAATHRDLPKWIAAGKFREDLFYRLSVFPIDIPPLRERQADIPPLVEEFVDRARMNYGTRLRFSVAAMQQMKSYAWPGNVRELANLVERFAVINADRVIEEHDLPWPIRPPSADDAIVDGEVATRLPAEGINLKEHLARVERRAIEEALGQANGVVQAAADSLGMGRTTLVEKIKRFGIES